MRTTDSSLNYISVITCSSVTQKPIPANVAAFLSLPYFLFSFRRKSLTFWSFLLSIFPPWLAARSYYIEMDGLRASYYDVFSIIIIIIIHDNYHYRFPSHQSHSDEKRENKLSSLNYARKKSTQNNNINKSKIIIPLSITAFKMLANMLARLCRRRRRCGASNFCAFRSQEIVSSSHLSWSTLII